MLRNVTSAAFSRRANKKTARCVRITVSVVMACCLFFAFPTLATTWHWKVKCKYSVRDVAFVNVHGKVWQLELIKPKAVDAAEFDKWNDILRNKLQRSNVGHVWLPADSREAQKWQKRPNSTHDSHPMMRLCGPNATVIPFTVEPSNSSFEQQVDLLLDSPARRKILDNLVRALCVVVLVESGNSLEDVNAANAATAAIDKLKRQMWTLEKPTDLGPVLVTIPASQKNEESWLLRSLGFEETNMPAVAIVYGQGRRLGEILTAENITVEKIVGRASICGQNCECDLDRNWLYGQQMIHVWPKRLERAAERSLDFDPNAALVMAEVAQILQKNSAGVAADRRVDLGGGLVIHDLDSIEPSADTATRQSKDDATSPVDSSLHDRDQSVQVPWTLVVVLLAIAVAIVVLRIRKPAK